MDRLVRFCTEYCLRVPGEQLRLSQVFVISVTRKGPRMRAARVLAVVPCCLVGHSLVSDLETLVDDGKGLAQLLLVNAERWVGVERVPAH